MSKIGVTVLSDMPARREREILEGWISEQTKAKALQKSGLKNKALGEQSARFLKAMQQAAHDGLDDDVQSPVWTESREILSEISTDLAKRGLTPTEVAKAGRDIGRYKRR